MEFQSQKIYFKDLTVRYDNRTEIKLDEVTAQQLEEWFRITINCYEAAIKYIYKEEKDDNLIDKLINMDKSLDQKIKEQTNFAVFVLAFATELNTKMLYILEEYSNIISTYHLSPQSPASDKWGKCAWKARTDAGGINTLLRNGLSNMPNRFNGHNLFIALYNIINNSIIDLVKYQMIVNPVKSFWKCGKLPTCSEEIDNGIIGAADILLINRGTQVIEESIKNINHDYVKLSEAFPKARYSDIITNKADALFMLNTFLSTHIVLVDLLKKKQYTQTRLLEDIESNLEIKNFDNYITACNFQYYDKINGLKNTSPVDYYILLTKFSKTEIEELIKNFCEFSNDSNEFENYLKYFIFFKKYITTNEFNYDDKKTKNIAQLFKTIRETNDLSLLGNQFAIWFNSIQLDLTEEEWKLIEINNPAYIYNSLGISEKIAYLKTKKENKNFLEYYKILSKNLSELGGDSFENIVSLSESKNFHIPYVARYYPYIGEEGIKKCAELSNKYDVEFSEIADCYLELDEENIKKSAELAKELHLKFSDVAYCYSELHEEGITKCADLSNKYDVEFSEIASYYLELREDDIKKCAELAKRPYVEFSDIARWYPNFSEEIITECVELSNKYQVKFSDMVHYYPLFPEEYIKKCGELAKELHLKFSDVAYYYSELHEEGIKKCADLVSKIDVEFYYVARYYPYIGEEGIKKCADLSKNYNEKFSEIVRYYPKLSEKDITKCEELANRLDLKFSGIAGCYLELGEDGIVKALECSKKLGIYSASSLSMWAQLPTPGINKKDILDLLSKVTPNEKMQVLGYGEIFKNINLVGVGEYIFYKTPKEIEKIKYYCVNNNIEFYPEFLFFDMEVLKKYISDIIFYIKRNLQPKINYDNTEYIIEIIEAWKEHFGNSQLNNNTGGKTR